MMARNPIVGPRSAAHAAILALCLALVSACTSLPRQELNSLGSQVSTQKVDFAALEADAQRARAAYQPPAQIQAAYPKTVRVATPAKQDVQYFIERDDKAKVQYLVVRGSANDINMKEDFAARIRKDRNIKIPVHSGFDDDAKAIWADAQPYLKKDYQTRLAGHSLGGAVAAILGIYAIEDGYKVQAIHTYGQPKFTTTAGATQLSFLPLLRVVDENDLVPLLPPGLLVPYAHMGPEVILLDGPNYVYLDAPGAEILSKGDMGRDLAVADLKDHKMQNYITRIATKLDGAKPVAYNAREKYIPKTKQEKLAAKQP
jgi:outer membrane murein-binding lipoprotein Lpp